MTPDQSTSHARRRSGLGVLLQRLLTRWHILLYRATGGRVGHNLGKMPILLLTTTGRKSGQPRVTPLTYLSEGDQLVLIASNAGYDNDPAWWLNLQARPQAVAQVKGRSLRVTAVRATPEEKARLWPRVVEMYAGYADYQRRTARDIPLVMLQPIT
jgi:deazaflavin-dependent oxidoreductase (nitroreductase family)